MGMRWVTSLAAASRFSPLQPAAVILFLLVPELIGLTRSAAISSSQRIAQGRPTTLGEYPSTLSLGLTLWANVYHLHYCSGSVLTERWAITSARCVEDAVEDVSRYYWLAGTNDLRQKGAHYPIKQVIIHPGYNPNDSLIHDIALVQVQHPFEFSATIQPIRLSAVSPDQATPGTPGVVVGWGEVSQSVIQPDVLRSADVTILDVDVCRDIYAPWELDIDGEYQFCAITNGDDRLLANKRVAEIEGENDRAENFAGRSGCRGDEGAPFIPRTEEFPEITLGFVALTYGCTPFGYPTVYTKASAYFQWISTNTGYW